MTCITVIIFKYLKCVSDVIQSATLSHDSDAKTNIKKIIKH